ncbi:hypothetical protein OH491_12350 [Termitidicoccus mucosus]
MKIKISIHLVGLFCMLLGASCSKEAQQKAVVPDIIYEDGVAPAAVFSATRNGHLVSLEWFHDFSACKSIEVLRNTTGRPRNRHRSALLKPETRRYEDTLPDTSSYWYWLKVTPPEGGAKTLGPVRVGADDRKIGSYSRISDKYPWQVRRDNATATIAWSFPNIKYRHIRIIRSTNPKNNRQEILTTLEWSSSRIDELPDPEADYWYWIEALLHEGTFVVQGPVKAEFAPKGSSKTME